ncbi:MAG: ABA4-like family protein [Pseudomonadota bacterium]
MSWETGFLLANLSVVPAWILLVFLPRSKITRSIVHSMVYPLGLGAVYAVVFAYMLLFGESSANLTTLAGVQDVFSTPDGILVGWVHYLLFDLFIGAWIGRDALERGISGWLRIPCQLASFVLGPIGLLVYGTVRGATGKGWSL